MLPDHYYMSCDDSDRAMAEAARLHEVLRRLEGRWKMVILAQLFARASPRFSELERAIPGISQKMLAQQLRELERDGIVARTVYAQVPPRVEYAITDLGRALRPAMVALHEWVKLWRAHHEDNAGTSTSQT